MDFEPKVKPAVERELAGMVDCGPREDGMDGT